ncbi:MAG: hypothetical protein ACI9HY_000944, partial [Planctomycetaceae bacterium]
GMDMKITKIGISIFIEISCPTSRHSLTTSISNS